MNDDTKKPKRPIRREKPESASKGPRRDAPGKVDVSPDTGDRTGERIAKRLARAGVASRRDAEEMIAAGRVAVNGKVLDRAAFNVSPADRIEIDGKEIPPIERTRLFLFHKPAGVVTTNKDPEGRRTVFDVLPRGLPRLLTVGRLDLNTEGLLLLTNDGGLSRVLELPATGWLRRYRARVHGKVDTTALTGLKDGIAVDGVFYGAIEAVLEREQGSNAWLSIGLREGKNREVKNVLGALGLEVTRLIRVSYGPFQLGALKEGEVQELRGRHLRDQLGEKLIAEAGANFDAPVVNEFSNRPVASEKEPVEPARTRAPDRSREARREDALGRLQTSAPLREERPSPRARGEKDDRDAVRARRDAPPARGGRDKDAGPAKGKGRFKPGAKPEEKRADAPRSRSANVWMAPGARAVGPKKAAARAEETEGRRYAGKPRPQRDGAERRDDRPTGRPAGSKNRFEGKRDAPGGKPVGGKRDGGGGKPAAQGKGPRPGAGGRGGHGADRRR